MIYDHDFSDHILEYYGETVAHVHGTVQVEYDDEDNWTAHQIQLGSGDTAVGADEVLTPEAVEALQESLSDHITDQVAELKAEEEEEGEATKVFDPSKHPRDDVGQFSGAGGSGRAAKRLAQRAIGDGSYQDLLDLGRVDGARFATAAGRNVDAWRLGLTAQQIRHTDGRHGPGSGDRNPVTADDYRNLPALLRIGIVTKGSRTKSQNLPTVIGTGAVRGQGYRAVMTVRKRTRSLQLHTLQRR